MADIKACDRCGHLFTPRGAWQVLHAITFGPMTESREQPRSDVTLEVCSACMYDPAKVVAPVLELDVGELSEPAPEPSPDPPPPAHHWPLG